MSSIFTLAVSLDFTVHLGRNQLRWVEHRVLWSLNGERITRLLFWQKTILIMCYWNLCQQWNIIRLLQLSLNVIFRSYNVTDQIFVCKTFAASLDPVLMWYIFQNCNWVFWRWLRRISACMFYFYFSRYVHHHHPVHL